MDPVILSPHNMKWSLIYQREKRKIQRILKFELVIMYHIGSTSIPEISAKPIIDILAEVKDINKIDEFNEEFIRIGYSAKGENGIEGRRFFVKPKDSSVGVHLHIFQIYDPHVRRHVDFRDYLIAHPSAAEEYEELKMHLAEKHKCDREAYTEGKTEFITEIEKTAIEWKRQVFSAPESAD